MKSPQHAEPSIITLFRITDCFIAASLFFLIGKIFDVPFTSNIDASALIFFIVIVVFTYFQVYRTWQHPSLGLMIYKLVEGCLIAFIILISMSFFSGNLQSIPKMAYLFWLIAWSTAILQVRLIFFIWKKSNISKGIFEHNAIIYGINSTTPELINWTRNNYWNAINIKHIFDESTKANYFCGIRVEKKYESIQSYVKNNNIDIVYVSSSNILIDEIKKISKMLSDTTASLYLISDFFSNDFVQNSRIMYNGDLLVYSLYDSPHQGFKYLIKRMEDIFLSIIGIVLTSPLLLFGMIGIKLTSPGPVFFQQWRYGLNGEKFKVLKLRTLNVEEDGYVFSQVEKDDPRLTKFGKFLRRTSIDELPQLFNVLLGKMSLVGPRPHAISMVNEYREQFPGAMKRHMIKPGLTGLAQIYGTRHEIKNSSEVQERLKYDTEYLKNWSLFMDLKILLYTMYFIVAKGAH